MSAANRRLWAIVILAFLLGYVAPHEGSVLTMIPRALLIVAFVHVVIPRGSR